MIAHIKVRADFVAASKALWQARPAVVVQARRRENAPEMRPEMRVGFTATKKIGNAVARNRAKRRLREAARLILPQQGKPGHDYVFVARATTGSCDWQALLDDVKAALIRLDAKGAARSPKPLGLPALPDRLQDKAVR